MTGSDTNIKHTIGDSIFAFFVLIETFSFKGLYVLINCNQYCPLSEQNCTFSLTMNIFTAQLWPIRRTKYVIHIHETHISMWNVNTCITCVTKHVHWIYKQKDREVIASSLCATQRHHRWDTDQPLSILLPCFFNRLYVNSTVLTIMSKTSKKKEKILISRTQKRWSCFSLIVRTHFSRHENRRLHTTVFDKTASQPKQHSCLYFSPFHNLWKKKKKEKEQSRE